MPVLEFLYKTVPGRLLLKPLTSRILSEASGRLMDTKASGILIKPFAKKNNICCDDYILDNVKSFNQFFCRRIKDGLRPIDADSSALVSPCDGLLTAYRINEKTVIPVKQSKFSIRSLLRSEVLAKTFEGGTALVFRLCVNHYHRYSFFDSGKCYSNRRINGVYHTVRPVALSEYPVFTENTREYIVIDTENFGRAVQMEVGAMLVGRIVNNKYDNTHVKRGEEKGHFEYGGSTIIVLLKKDSAVIREDIINNSGKEIETPVLMGEKIGVKDGHG
jgi:Phosphatidylserine decarboxylase